jgi:hypothetical protein
MRSPIWQGDKAPSALWRYSSGAGHFSLDLPLPIGTALYAPGNGRVLACNDGVHNQPQGRPAGSGAPSNWLLIEYTPTGGKYRGQRLRAYLQHLDKGGTLGARPGKTFKAGERIAESGNSGNTTGSHLHLTVFKPGRGPSGSWDRYQYLSDPSRVVWPITEAWGEGGDTYTVYVSKLRPGVEDSKSVRRLRMALLARGLLKPRSKAITAKRPGNDYTPAVVEAVKLWQKRHGYKQTGTLTLAQAKEFFKNNTKTKVVA